MGLDLIPEKGLSIAAGFVGAAISAIARHGESKPKRAISFLCGFACACFLAPWAAEAIDASQAALGGLSFLFGVTGDWLVYSLIRDPLGLWRRLRGQE